MSHNYQPGPSNQLVYHKTESQNSDNFVSNENNQRNKIKENDDWDGSEESKSISLSMIQYCLFNLYLIYIKF